MTTGIAQNELLDPLTVKKDCGIPESIAGVPSVRSVWSPTRERLRFRTSRTHTIAPTRS
jgi:hypothetical protein